MYYMRRRQRRLGQRLYVAPPPTGNDTTGNGSRTAPYATILKASTVATAGTTVYVAPGTYGSVYMTGSTGGGTAGNPVTYISTVKWGAIITPGSPPEWAWYIGNQASNHPDHIRIIDFAITAPSSPNGINVAASDVWVIGCHVHHVHNETSADSAGGGIVLEGYLNDGSGAGYKGTGNAAIGNWVHDIGHANNGLCHPIYVASASGYVANNLIYTTGGWGIHCYHGPNGTKVVNNTVFDCQGSDAGGILFGGGDGLPIEPLTTSGTVNNNIVRDCHIGITENGTASGVTYRDNWIIDCDINLGGDAATNDAGTTVVDTDPGMGNYQVDGTGNYYLTGSSAASTTGILTDSPAEDFDRIGRLRPQPGVGAFRTATGVYLAPATPVGSALPVKVAGAYWPQWETVYPDQIHSGINALWIAFAINNGTNGSVYWDGMYGGLNEATFEDRVQTTRSAGRCCILSLGGEFVTLSIDSAAEVTNFVNSIKALYTTWGGFDGIDWDIEGGHITSANRQYHEAASRELKDFYGANFAIAMSYQGPDVQYKTMAQNLEATGDLDWASIQYYDYPNPQTSDVVSRLSEMVNTYGVSPAHLGIGVKFESGNSSTWTHANAISMWNTVEATYPTLRGMVTWETIQDRTNSNDFADTVAPVITS